MVYVGIDVGGTNYRIGLIHKGKLITGTVHKGDTPKGTPNDLVKAIGGSVHQIMETDHYASLPQIQGIGISFAGATNDQGVVWKAPNIWGHNVTHIPLATMVRDETGIPTTVINDMTAAAFREKHFGVGRDLNSFLIITVSSGVGAKQWRGNNIIQGEDGVTGEIGHFVIDPFSTVRCGCGGFGHLESLASGMAAEGFAQQMATSDPAFFSQSILYLPAQRSPQNINNHMLAEAAIRSDKLALSVLDRVTMPLAMGINHVWAMSKPEKVIIIGGFALNIGEPYFASLRRALLKTGLFGVNALTHDFLEKLIIRGTDDDSSGMIGAAAAAEARNSQV